MSSVFFIASSSSLSEMKLSLSIPETLCYSFTGLHFGQSGSKYIQTLCLSGIPSLGLLFQSTFKSFVCWLEGQMSDFKLFLASFVYVLLLLLNFSFFWFTGRPVNRPFDCWGLTTICNRRIKIDFWSWTDYQQNGSFVNLKATCGLTCVS